MAELGDGRESNQKLQEEVSSHRPTFLRTASFDCFVGGAVIWVIINLIL